GRPSPSESGKALGKNGDVHGPALPYSHDPAGSITDQIQSMCRIWAGPAPGSRCHRDGAETPTPPWREINPMIGPSGSSIASTVPPESPPCAAAPNEMPVEVNEARSISRRWRWMRFWLLPKPRTMAKPDSLSRHDRGGAMERGATFDSDVSSRMTRSCLGSVAWGTRPPSSPHDSIALTPPSASG